MRAWCNILLIKTKIITFIAISSLPLVSGCCKLSTDSSVVFSEVQQEVCQRSGEQICWNKGQPSEQFHAWLTNTLKESLELETVIQIAMLNNHRLQATYADLGIAQAQLVQSSLLQNPIFGMSIRFERVIESANIIEMGLVQNFLDILLKPLKIRLARSELEWTKAHVAAAVLDIIAETKMAFFSMRAAEESLDLTKEFLAAREISFDAAKRLYEAGNITDLAFTIEQSSYEQAKIDYSNAELELISSRERLNQAMGLWGSCLEWKLSKKDPSVSEISCEDFCLEERVVSNSLDLKMARQKMRITAQQYGLARTETVFPELMIGPDSERDPGEPWFFGPQFAIGIPIFDFGIARKAQARSELCKQWNDYIALAIQIRSETRFAAYRLQSALKQYKRYQKVILPLEEKITQETLRQLNGMQLGVIELLATKQREIETKLKSITSYRDYWIARAEVELLLSGGMLSK